MALSPTSKPARGRPTVGRKLAFHVPLPPAKGAETKNFDDTDKQFARIYCKDSVGKFLGLPLANYRKLLTAPRDIPGGEIGPGGAAEVIRAVSDRVSAKPYTILLAPGTLVEQGKYVWYRGANADDGLPNAVELRTLEFSLPGYMPVWRLLDWLTGQRDTYDIGNGRSAVLPGMTFDNYSKIIALITPAQRTYPLASLLYEDRVPPPNPDGLDNPATP